FSTRAKMLAWDAPSGSVAWVEAENSEYVMVGTTWRISYQDTGWLALTIVTGTGQYSPAYRLKNGEVVLRGAVSGTVAGSVVLVANLPPGFRPAVYQWYPSSINNPQARAANVS